MLANSNSSTTLQTAQAITLGNSVSTFIETALLGDSAANVRWYRARLRLFVTALGAERDLASITERDLILWYKSLKERTEAEPPTLSVDTMHGYVRAVRRLFKWLYERRVTVTEMWPILKLPTLPEQERKGINDNHADQIVAAAKDWSARDYAIVLFFDASGARRGGVASLRLSDIDLNAPEPFCQRATVREKGKRIRTVFMSPETQAAMIEWLDVRRAIIEKLTKKGKKFKPTEYVFIDEDNGMPLQAGGISQILDRYKKRLKIVGRCSPHQWRHRFARVRLMDDVPLNVVGQLLGHKSVTVTAKHYGNLLVNELQSSYNAHLKKKKNTPES